MEDEEFIRGMEARMTEAAAARVATVQQVVDQLGNP